MSLYAATRKQPERRATVLAHIAAHGPRIEYELYEELGMSRGTTHHALKRLAELGLLKRVLRRKEGAAREAIQFHLTTLGLLAALTMSRASKGMQKIVKIWPEVCPKILLNWKKLSTNLGRHYFKNKVLSVAFTILSGEIPTPYEVRCGEPIDYADLFTTVFLNPFLVAETLESAPREKERFVRAVCGIPELRSELSGKLMFFEEAYRSRLDMVRHLQHMVEAESAHTSTVSAGHG